MAGPSGDEMSMVEEREELMVSPTVGIPTMRIAHFLKPIVSSIKASDFKLPFLTPKSKWPLHVSFNGWRDPQRRWNKWVDRMQSRHGDLWEKAGIFKAIMFSRYRFPRNDELIFGVAERWCCDTNTFVFPWGEATVTLEDVMILGGLSILGSPVFMPAAGKELEEAVDGLRKLHEDLPSHVQWLNFFMTSGMKNEHEAFLGLWLSRFVFPGNECDKIGEHVFPIAVNLSRGKRIAPAVLACIYKDLGQLKGSMTASAQLEAESDEESFLALGLWAPLQLVQLWVWERFLVFRPKPKFLNFGEIRAARWHNVKRPDIGNVRPIFDSCVDIFLWRPYTLTLDGWPFPKFYKEEEWVQMDRFWDEELESFARCLRTCVLIGIDHCAEPYQPHRVAMQFGFDQDPPALVSRFVQSLEAAWINYSKPLSNDSRLYLPARLFESDLSAQYWKWWNHTVLLLAYPFPGVLRRPRTPRTMCQNLSTTSEGRAGPGNSPVTRLQNSSKVQIKVEANDLDVPPGFPPKRKLSYIVKSEACSKNQLTENGDDDDVPPGFPPKKRLNYIVKPEACGNNRIKGNGNDGDDVPPGFPPKWKLNSIVKSEACGKNQLIGNDNDGDDVPPGFPPKTKLSSLVKLETCSKNQLKGNGNDRDVPPEFPAKTTNIPNFSTETCRQKQRKEGGNNSEDAPGFPSKKDHCPVIRPETSAKIKEECIQTDRPIGLPLENNKGSQIMRPESFTEKEIKEEVDLNFSPTFPQELITQLKQSCTPGGLMPTFDSWCETGIGKSAQGGLQPSSASQIQRKCSSTTTGMRASESAQNPRQSMARTLISGGGAAAYSGRACERRNGDLTHYFTSLNENENENGGQHNCSFQFGTEIIKNMGACLKP